MREPAPHRELRIGAARALALPAAAAAVAEALARGSLHEVAAAHPEVRVLGGRARAFRIPAPQGGGEAGAGLWVVRHYARGGAVAGPLLGDRYLRVGTPRPFRELAASEGARRRGVRTPRVVAAVSYPAGPFRRGDIVTEWVADAVELAEAVFARDPKEVERALERAGRLVRELAMAGVEHADLNARNVLLADGEDGPVPWVLDLDRARLRREATVSGGVRMLARLERSLTKLAGAAGAAFTPDLRTALRRGAGDLNDAPGRDLGKAAGPVGEDTEAVR